MTSYLRESLTTLVAKINEGYKEPKKVFQKEIDKLLDIIQIYGSDELKGKIVTVKTNIEDGTYSIFKKSYSDIKLTHNGIKLIPKNEEELFELKLLDQNKIEIASNNLSYLDMLKEASERYEFEYKKSELASNDANFSRFMDFIDNYNTAGAK